MEHYFEIPVEYKGEEQSFKGRLSTFGYTYKFFIIVNGHELVFEKDDDGKYRGINETNDLNKTVDIELLKAIVFVLDGLVEAY